MRLTFTLLAAAAASAAALRLPSQCTLPKRPSSSSRRDAVALASTSLAALLAPPLQPALADEVIAVNILNEGDKSSALAQRAQTAIVDYTLWINDFEAKQIDTSKGGGFPPKLPSPFKFNVGVGQVIKGWDRTVMEMHVGEKRRVVIPAELGYGAKGVGPIPGGASLYFEIELLELKPLPKLSEQQLKWLEDHPM